MRCMLYTRNCRIIAQGIVSRGEKAEDKDQGREHNDEWNISPQTSTQEQESNDGHHHIVIALSSVEFLAQGTGDRLAVDGRGVRRS